MSGKNVFRAVCAAGGVLLVAGSVAPGAAAVVAAEDSGDVQATVRKTVRQTANASGEVDTSRLYMQVSAVGNGTKTVKVPVGVTSNRNLNAFGPFPMEGESIVFDLNVDGSVEERTLTEAPLEAVKVSVKVMLDGQEVQPADLVGADGVVDVEYTVRNTTSRQEEVTYTDWEGKEQKATIEVADPYVGSLDVTLPQGFNEVTAPGATIAGNGQNETNLGYTFVLFPPLGATEAKISYQSRVTNGQMPEAVFSFLPIVPFENSTIAGTAEAYKGGAATGTTIAGAGQQIGENLLKLQEGAGQLVAGLGQLAAGANQLSDGLVNTAAPGSAALADGANQVSDGLSELNSNVPALEEGVSDLNSGAQQLNGGAQQVADGNEALADGMAKLQAGIDTLSKGVANLPSHVQATDGYKQLQAALAGVQAAIGTASDSFVPAPKTLNGAINALEFGLNNPGCDPGDPENAANPCGFKQVLKILEGSLDNANPATPGAKQALQKILAVLGTTPAGGSLPLGGFVTATNSLVSALGCAPDAGSPTGGFCAAIDPSVDPANSALTYATLGFYLQALGSTSIPADTVLYGLNAILTKIGSASTPGTALYAINGLIEGIGAKSDFPTTSGTLYYGLEGIRAGLTNPSCNLQDPQNPKNPCGIKEIQALVAGGINQLVAGISAELLKGIGTTPVNAASCSPTTLTCASAQLNAGAQQLASGSAQLAAGTTTLAAGTKELNSKVPTLASGVQQLDDGAAQVADGADQLAEGLGAAADGSSQIADGLGQAEPGAGQIEDGAGQLKEQGADELVKSGAEAQLGFAADVATLQAQQLLGEEGAGIPFGLAEGTNTVTTGAIQLTLAGIAADTENNAVKFGLGAALIAGAAGAAYAGRRKVLA